MLSFPSVVVLVSGSIYSLFFCVVAYLEGKDGVKSFLAGSENFIQRLTFEHTAKLLQLADEFFPKVLLIVERCGGMIGSSITFLAERLFCTSQFIIHEFTAIALIIIFFVCIFSLVCNYGEVRHFLLATLEILGNFLAAVFSILHDPSKLASIALISIVPQFLFYIYRAELMKS